jgi:hypothetical protein
MYGAANMQNFLAGRIHWLHVYVLIFITCFAVYFLYCNRFGAYSDDQFFFGAMYLMGHTGGVLLGNALSMGRPLSSLTLSTLYPLFAVGGLPLAYLGSCIVLSIETLLVFYFFRQFIADLPSLILALVYLLFPPDVSKFMFIIAFQAHVSGIIFWISSILYARRMPAKAALIAVASMLVYETHLIQALFIPLICYTLGRFSLARSEGWRQELRPGAKFLAVFALAGGAVLIGRFVIAPGRLSTRPPNSLMETCERFLRAGFSGIKGVIRSHADRVITLESDNLLTICIVLCGVLTLIFLLYSRWGSHRLASEETGISQYPPNWRWALTIVFLGLIIMFASYLPFALEPSRFPPSPITTRLSSVHYGASVGYVILWAGLYGVTATWGRGGFLGFLSVFILYFLVIGGFFIRHQEQLVQNWQTQTIYWEEIEQCLRTTDPKLIIIDDTDEEIRGGRAELLFDWTTPYVPYLVKHSFRQAAEWPLVVGLTAFKVLSKIEVVGDYAELSDMTTWYAFPTELRVKLSDIMLVKPFRGALVPPSISLDVDGTKILPGDRCYIRSAGFAQ